MFEEASNDRFVEVYNNSKIPIIFLIPRRGIFHLQMVGLHTKQLDGNL